MDQARADASSPAAGGVVLGIMRPEGCAPGRPVPYGARNAVSAASVSSGVSSATQWVQPGMTRVCNVGELHSVRDLVAQAVRADASDLV
jgi:hypothetical protein